MKAVNVTKYDAGGSGDNIISDGYIKTVEKVWIDIFTMSQTATKTTIDIAVIPANKKITGIDVMVETSASQTSGTISIGFNTDANIDSLVGAQDITHALTLSTISLVKGLLGTTANGTGGSKLSGFQKVTAGTQTTVSILLNNWTMSTGTIKSIVRYT